MKDLFKFLLVTLALLVSQMSFANDLKSVDFKNRNSDGSLVLELSHNLEGLPNLQVDKNEIIVTLPKIRLGQKVFPEKATFATKTAEDTLIEYKETKDNSYVYVKFPFNMEKKENAVHLKNMGNKLVINFPKVRIPEPVNIFKTNEKIDANLGEDYLNDLLAAEKVKVVDSKLDNKVMLKNKKSAIKGSKSFLDLDSDTVKTTKASGAKATSDFSFTSYAGKFVAFLGGVLLLFYFVVNMFKKGVISRGKLGFLNNSNLIQVLSTTFVSPKKSLLLVKAHNQVFLVSNTDQGMSFISEINDSNDLFKAGEKSITGTNFDENLGNTNTEHIEERITLKADINQSTPVSGRSKFSDQLKNKVKGLRPLN